MNTETGMELTELKAEKVMTIRADCPDDKRLWVGKNDFGLLRAIYITGGTFHGARICGTVLPMGGADWNTGFGGEDPEHFTSVEVYASICSRPVTGFSLRFRILAGGTSGENSPIL